MKLILSALTILGAILGLRMVGHSDAEMERFAWRDELEPWGDL